MGFQQCILMEIILEDPNSKVEVHLLYGVLEENDIITRAVKIINQGKAGIVLQKAASMNLDWMNGEYEWITFYGRHVMERNVQRSALDHGIHAIGSVRGTSIHHYNPFAIVCEKNADEEKDCAGTRACLSFSTVRRMQMRKREAVMDFLFYTAENS